MFGIRPNTRVLMEHPHTISIQIDCIAFHCLINIDFFRNLVNSTKCMAGMEKSPISTLYICACSEVTVSAWSHEHMTT